jgi:hypothetical protein
MKHTQETMLIKGTAPIGSYTLEFSIHGQRNDWKITVTAPGNIVTECETGEATWFPLFSEMLADAHAAAGHNRIPASAGVGR